VGAWLGQLAEDRAARRGSSRAGRWSSTHRGETQHTPQPGRATAKGPGKVSLRGEKRKEYFCFPQQSSKEHHRAGSGLKQWEALSKLCVTML